MTDDRKQQIEYLAKKLMIPEEEAHILVENMETQADG